MLDLFRGACFGPGPQVLTSTLARPAMCLPAYSTGLSTVSLMPASTKTLIQSGLACIAKLTAIMLSSRPQAAARCSSHCDRPARRGSICSRGARRSAATVFATLPSSGEPVRSACCCSTRSGACNCPRSSSSPVAPASQLAIRPVPPLSSGPGDALNQAAILRPGRCNQPRIKIGGVHGCYLPLPGVPCGPVGNQQRNGAVARTQVGNACLPGKRAALVMPEPCYLAVINAGEIFRQGGQRPR